MPTRARQALIGVLGDTRPNAVAGAGGQAAVSPIPFPTKDAITGATDWVIFTSGAEEVSDEQDRASRALQHHLELIARTDGWKRIGAHEHPQLESEPDD